MAVKLTSSSKLNPPKIIYQDESLIVIHKPAGMLVYGEGKAKSERGAKEWLESELKIKVFPIHRLDKGTCGLIVFGIRPKISTLLQKAFRERRISKKYRCLVKGKTLENGSIATPLINKEKKEESAKTTYHTRAYYDLGTDGFFSLVEAEPKTGRFHQIRKHLASIKHPLIGDEEYGIKDMNAYFKEQYQIKRPLLCSTYLSFIHPETKKKMIFETKPDPDFSKLLRAFMHEKDEEEEA